MSVEEASPFTRREDTGINKACVAEDGRIKGDTQTCYVFALVVGLVDGEKAKLTAKYLVENIEARNNHLSTGVIGTKDLMFARIVEDALQQPLHERDA